jgi:radical SAM protein with 4Fe4S-binding SPASM domain
MEGKMKIQAKELRSAQRTSLQDVIPLDTPYTVFIDPSNACTLKCKYCPTGDNELLQSVGRFRTKLGTDLFLKVVENLKMFTQKIKRINMYKDGEPLLNPDFPWMVERIKEAGVAEQIWVKTNGTLLNPERNTTLASCGLDMIGISVKAVSTKSYLQISDNEINYKKFLENILNLYNIRGQMKLYASIADYGLTAEEKQKFIDDFSPITDFCAIEGLHGWSMSSVKDFTLGTNPTTFDGLPLVDKNVCPWVFYQIAVNSDGSVSACNEDWAHGVIIGDIQENTLVEIWTGEKLYNLRRLMLEGRRNENPICGDCYYLKCAPDNIDRYANQVFEKLNKTQEKI